MCSCYFLVCPPFYVYTNYTGDINLGQFYPVFTFFATYQNKRIVSCILINRTPIYHCVLINFSFSIFVKAEIRQKLKV